MIEEISTKESCIYTKERHMPLWYLMKATTTTTTITTTTITTL
jgi:hypothetical protein